MNIEDALKHNTEQVQPCIAPLMIYPKKDDFGANESLCGGTCFFVKSKYGLFLITAEHVYREVKACGDERIPLILVPNGAQPVDISDWALVSSCSFLDIAVVKIPESFELESIGKDAFTHRTSPDKRVAVKESVFFVGFPGEHRYADKKTFIARMLPCMDFVTTVNDRAFFMSDETLERTSTSFETGIEKIENFGGLSGSPMLVVRDGVFELVGVFIEGGFQEEGIHSPFRGAHFDFINADGSLDEIRIPYPRT